MIVYKRYLVIWDKVVESNVVFLLKLQQIKFFLMVEPFYLYDNNREEQ